MTKEDVNPLFHLSAFHSWESMGRHTTSNLVLLSALAFVAYVCFMNRKRLLAMYRFIDGVASRGKLAVRSMPVPDAKWDLYHCSLSGTVNSFIQQSSNSSFDITPSRSLDHINHQSRSLLKYYETVKSAVLAAAASHISLKHCVWKPLASKYRMAAIRGLNQRSTAEYPNKSIDYSKQMIIVGTDFHILLRMMKSFIESQQCSNLAETEPLGTFLMQQIRKMSLYAGPLVMGLSAAKSLENMSNKDLDFLFSCLKIHPEYSSVIFKLANLIRTAAQIYLSRATNMPNQVITELVQQRPHFDLAIFIVGAECSSKQDREFVTIQLQNLWDCTGFGSPLYAIKLLGDIWQETPGTNWTQTLMDKVEGFIM
ncbi:hypothetical protein BDV33DRAFT_196899 [Aspergillus novoparasiticus]|uniref:Fungal-specific transcription factor domain-containing protein n=1 Tax=Aspergillus novoparasiticus TaxID=986946 RepID=A0A5N6E7E5_9EURO|nr:hypothetical protein BDV33DRAFT_196899 [Aspergillus novoparasiticus]